MIRIIKIQRSFLKLSVILLIVLNVGCSTSYYLFQAGRGQLRLFNRAQPIDAVISNPKTDPALARLLKFVPEIKKYAEQFGLKPTPNYQEFVSLDQDSVVYVVTVCQPLKFEPKIFSFPLVGSFNYLGWFAEQDAQKFAQGFEKEGLDVDVRGASAYSTLGWFKDPLLSSMIPKHEGKIHSSARAELVNVVIHESVHATLYFKNQSYFNEGIASFVADVLTKQYFESLQLQNDPEWVDYQKREEYGVEIRTAMLKAVEDLKAVYESPLNDAEKLKRKAEVVGALQTKYPFFRKISNATLVQYQTYHSSENDFKNLYLRKNSDLATFFKVLSKLKPEQFEKSQQEDFSKLFATL